MLNITCSTHDLSAPEARGLVAMLVAIHGPEVLPENVHVSKTVGAVNVTVNAPSPDIYKQVADGLAASVAAGTDRELGKRPELAMGYGAGQEPDAASVFAAQPEPEAAAVFGGTTDAAPLSTSVAGDVDKDGIPWDERIHSSSKAKTEKGFWQRRRNTPDALFDSVKASLLALVKAGAPAIAPPPPVDTAPANVPAPPPPAADGAVTFPGVMKRMTEMQRTKQLGGSDHVTILTALGAEPPSVITMNKTPDLLPRFSAVLDMIAAGLPLNDAIAAAG